MNYESSKSKKKGCLIFSEWNPWSHKQMIKQYDWLGKNWIRLYSKLFKNKVKRQKTNRKTICNVFRGQKAHILKRNIFHYLTHSFLANTFLTHFPLLAPFQSHCSLFSLNIPNTVSISRHLNYSSVSELVSYIPWETVPGLPLRYQNPQWCSSPYIKWHRTKDTAAPPYPQMPNLCI